MTLDDNTVGNPRWMLALLGRVPHVLDDNLFFAGLTAELKKFIPKGATDPLTIICCKKANNESRAKSCNKGDVDKTNTFGNTCSLAAAPHDGLALSVEMAARLCVYVRS